MHRRRELLIGVLIGLSFMLLASLAAAIAPRSRMAYAQSNPWISISIGEDTLPQGGATYLVGGLNNMPQDPNDDGKFHPDLRYRFDLERNNEGTWTEANECEESSFVGSDNYIGTWYRSPLDVGTGSLRSFTIPSNCPVGSYRVLATAKYSPNTIIVTATHDLTIIHGPEVSIQLSSDSFYRGTSTAVTLEFNHLNNIQDDPTLSYRADVMRIISENSMNYANDCEGTGLGNIVKTGETNNSNFNSENNPSGTIDDQDGDEDQDGDGAVEISGQIPATCPTGRYRLTVDLWDSSKRILTSDTQEFVVSTDPNATPSSRIEFSPQPPVAEGTEIDATITFYDLQHDTAIREIANVTKRVGSKDVVEASCHAGGIGLGQDVQSRVTRNPMVRHYSISSSCPAGSYTITGVISTTTGTELVSASADFIVGDPPPPNKEPVFTHTSGATYTAKVGSQFNQPLPAGSGGDGELRYTATGLPQGLVLNSGNQTVSGIPEEHGTFVVSYKVLDDDDDEDSRTFTIDVEEDLTPTFNNPPSGTYSARTESEFRRDLPAASDGDEPYTYAVTGLPPGLDFISDQVNDPPLRIEGTPELDPQVESKEFEVTYKAEDVDGDQVSAPFKINVTRDKKPSFDTPPPSGTYPARTESQFRLDLPAAINGDGPYTYTVTSQPPLPAELSFDKNSFDITGTPKVAQAYNVTYTATDVDGDPVSATFTIDVKQNEEPTFTTNPPSDTYSAKEGRLFTQPLPAASGGDGDLRHWVEDLPGSLEFITTTRTITGTLDANTAGDHVVTYKVADEDGDQASATFTIEVEEDFTPTFTNLPSSTHPAKEGRRFKLTLQPGSGGDGDLRHWVENLPDGLVFIPATRTITGTLNANTAGDHVVTYKVADEDGDEASATFTIEVEENVTPTFTNPPSGAHPAKERRPFTLTLQAGSGGDGSLRHWVEGLPDGLQFNTTTFTITGTPSEIPDGILASVNQVTYKVADEDGDEGSATFTIEVRQNEKPTLPNLSSEIYAAKERRPFTLTLQAASGGEGNLTHSVDGLPDGLEFNPTTFTFAGMPTTGTAKEYEVRYKVKDEDPEVVSTTFKIVVSANEMPTITDLPIEVSTAKERRLFEQDLPAASGGEGNLTYWVEGLPDGLDFIADTRKITGTLANNTAGTHVVTYKVKDDDPEVVSTTFKIVVSANAKPTLTDLSNEVYLAKEQRLFPKVLPAGSGGEGNLTHWVEDLPDGLDFIPATFTITGTLATNTAGEHVVTYKVKDDDPEVTSTTFKITVYELPTLDPISDVSTTKDEEFSLKPSTVKGGRAPFTYTTTTLPTGLTFNKTSHAIEGTPTEEKDTDVTFTVTDADGDTASVEFQISVKQGDTEPSFPAQMSLEDQTARVGSYFELLNLPNASGGNRPYIYRATGLPAGLALYITDTQVITGTPEPVTGGNYPVTYTVTYAVTDRDLDEVALTFAIVVTEDHQPDTPIVSNYIAKLTVTTQPLPKVRLSMGNQVIQV